jgi:hypothetical protein
LFFIVMPAFRTHISPPQQLHQQPQQSPPMSQQQPQLSPRQSQPPTQHHQQQQPISCLIKNIYKVDGIIFDKLHTY